MNPSFFLVLFFFFDWSTYFYQSLQYLQTTTRHIDTLILIPQLSFLVCDVATSGKEPQTPFELGCAPAEELRPSWARGRLPVCNVLGCFHRGDNRRGREMSWKKKGVEVGFIW